MDDRIHHEGMTEDFASLKPRKMKFDEDLKDKYYIYPL